MSESPPDLSATDDARSASPVPWNYWGWIGLALMFVFLIVSGLSRTSSKEQGAGLSVGEAEIALRKEIARKLDKSGVSRILKDRDQGPKLADIAQDLVLLQLRNPRAAAVRGALLVESGKPVPGDTIRVLQSSSLPEYRAAARVFSDAKLAKADLPGLDRALEPLGFTGRVIGTQAATKAGIKDARRGLATASGVRAVIAGSIFLLAVAIGAAGWLGYLLYRATGEFPALGLPLDPASEVEADRVALRGLQVFFGFMLVSTVVAIVASALRLGQTASQYLTAAVILAGLALLFRTPLTGKPLSMADIGFKKDRLTRNIGFGVLGACMELPISVAVLLLLRFTFPNLPGGGHPAEQISLSTDFVSRFGWLLLGVVVAPIWEEVFFRGLLFPALKGLLSSVTVAALVSSTLFAVIHPQGPAAFASLAVTGLASCVLVAQTRSLVPSVVMHMVHNGILFSVALLAQ